MKDYKNYYNGEFYDYDNTDPNYIIANQKYPTAVDDENISNETTYSSKKIEELVSISGFKTVFVDELPDVGEHNTIYFVPCDISGGTDYYDEYMWNETKGEWELIGNTRIDMSLYYTKQETDDIVSNINEALGEESEARISGDEELRSALAEEVANRISADSALTIALEQEVLDRESAISTISSITEFLSASTVSEIGRLDIALSGKQDSFLCGENVEIKDGYLSALGYTYNRDAQSMSEGYNSIATGWASHVEGIGTVATNDAEHAEGAYNVSNNGTIHSVGIGYKDNGTQEINRKNAVEVLYNGNVYVHGVGGYLGETLENVSSLQDILNSKSNTGHTHEQYSLTGHTHEQYSLTSHTHTAAEVGALPDSTVIPSKTSDLTNDSGFITGYTLPIASSNALGGVKINGNNLSIGNDGTLSATDTTYTAGKNMVIEDNVIKTRNYILADTYLKEYKTFTQSTDQNKNYVKVDGTCEMCIGDDLDRIDFIIPSFEDYSLLNKAISVDVVLRSVNAYLSVTMTGDYIMTGSSEGVHIQTEKIGLFHCVYTPIVGKWIVTCSIQS